MNRRLKFIGLLVLMNGVILETLDACMCVEETIETADYERHDEIFIGKLLNIQYFEVTASDGTESFNLGGAEYTFEVIKKWKGSNARIVKIKELLNSCSVRYHMIRGEWLVSAHQKKWTMEVLEREYDKPFLQSDGCSLNLYYQNPKQLKMDMTKLDQFFPKEIQLAKEMNTLRVVLLFGIASSLLSLFLYLKLKV